MDAAPAGPRILVVGPAWVGDLVMAQSLLLTLKQQTPAPQLHVLAPAGLLPLLERMPEVERGIPLPVSHGRLDLGTRRRLARQLALAGYGQAILLPNSWKSALVPWWAKIPRRTGWRGEMRWGLLNDLRQLDPRQLPTTVQRFVALALDRNAPVPGLDTLPRPRLRVDPDAAQRAMQRLGLRRDPARRLLALCPGAEFGPAKRWPPEHYGELARILHPQGWQIWLFGSPQDQPDCATLDQVSGGLCTNLAGRTSLGEAVDLLSLADLVVSNDSGLMHVAAALDRPLVALFGSTDPGHTPPLGRRQAVVALELPCRPCFQRTCPLGHLDCLVQLPVQRVVTALEGLLP